MIRLNMFHESIKYIRIKALVKRAKALFDGCKQNERELDTNDVFRRYFG